MAIVPQAFGVEMYRSHTTQFDMDFIDMKVLDVQLLYLDDTPGYYLDNADLIKVTVEVTNNGYEFFVLHDKMFRIWVMEPDIRKSTPDNEVLEIVDNYDSIYDVHLEVNFDDFNSKELFDECDYTNTLVHRDKSKTLTVCYEVLRIWANEALSLEGNKKYFLVMMDNTQATSCPNCKKELLSFTKPTSLEFDMPPWVENLFSWHARGLISDSDFENSLIYLKERGIVVELNPQLPEMTLEQKNQMLKEHQAKLSAAMPYNLYVSASNFYEPRYFDQFSGVLCRQQNNIVTFSGDYQNADQLYDAIFFKLLLYNDLGDIIDTGLAKEVDVAPDELRHFEISTPYSGKINYCLGMIDSKFN